MCGSSVAMNRGDERRPSIYTRIKPWYKQFYGTCIKLLEEKMYGLLKSANNNSSDRLVTISLLISPNALQKIRKRDNKC